MKIAEFISHYKNHPVLFVGTGISLRYLKKSFTWDGLLRSIAIELKGSPEYYLDIKSSCVKNETYEYEKIALKLEKEFNEQATNDRNGNFKDINGGCRS